MQNCYSLGRYSKFMLGSRALLIINLLVLLEKSCVQASDQELFTFIINTCKTPSVTAVWLFVEMGESCKSYLHDHGETGSSIRYHDGIIKVHPLSKKKDNSLSTLREK